MSISLPSKAAQQNAIESWYVAGLEDPVHFAQSFFPDWYTTAIPWVHRGVLALLTRKTDFLLKYGEIDKIERHFVWREDFDDDTSVQHKLFVVERDEAGEPVRIDLAMSPYTLIMMPRGFAKTTLSNTAIIYLICYKIREFLIYASETGPHSEQQVRNIRNEFEANANLIAVFGDLRPEQRKGLKWTDELLEFSNGCVLAAKSRGKQIRGMLNRGRRPDFQLLDDVEDEESVATAPQRDKSLKWLYGSVIPAFKKGGDGWLLMTGTLLHTDALLMTVARSGDFNTVRFGAIDPDGDPLWAWNMDQVAYDRKKASYARVNQLATFYKEYMNLLRSDETAKFNADMFMINYTPLVEILYKAIVMDPAISKESGADDCAFAVTGMLDSGLIKVLECCGQRGMSPREQVDKYFELRKEFGNSRSATPIRHSGVEAVAYQAALIHLLKEEMFRKKDYFAITPITHKQKKSERIEGILQPRFASGYIEFNKPLVKLRTQLLDWPNGHDDYPDVLAMSIALLDPHAAMAADPEDDLAADEYEPLEQIIGNFRGAP